MKFKILFIAIMIVIGIIFYVYPAYQLLQVEDKVRQSIKNIPNNAAARNLQNLNGYHAKAEVLNQYPKFFVYITLEQYQEKIAPKEVIEFIQDFSCKGLESLKDDSDIYRKANLNVIKKDQHQFEFIVKNIFGDTLFKHTQITANCPNFIELENYIAPKQPQNSPPMPPSAEAEARERQFSNGY